MEQRLLLGVFDIVHVGHLTQINSVSQENVELTAAVLSDQGIRELLGCEPFLPEHERAAVLAGMRAISKAVVVGPETHWQLPTHDSLFIDSDLQRVLPNAGVDYAHAAQVDIVRLPANPKLVSAARVA